VSRRATLPSSRRVRHPAREHTRAIPSFQSWNCSGGRRRKDARGRSSTGSRDDSSTALDRKGGGLLHDVPFRVRQRRTGSESREPPKAPPDPVNPRALPADAARTRATRTGSRRCVPIDESPREGGGDPRTARPRSLGEGEADPVPPPSVDVAKISSNGRKHSMYSGCSNAVFGGARSCPSCDSSPDSLPVVYSPLPPYTISGGAPRPDPATLPYSIPRASRCRLW